MGKFTTFGMQQEHKQQSDESDESEDELAMNKKKEEEEDLILGPDDSEIKNTTFRRAGLLTILSGWRSNLRAVVPPVPVPIQD